MKKILALVLALVLSLSLCSALAASSSNTENYTTVTTDDNAGLSIFAVNEATLPADQLANFQVAIDQCANELPKLAEQGVDAYFGAFIDKDGNTINAYEALETEALNCNEFCPIVAVCNDGIDTETVTVTLRFLTPYEVGQKVIVALGIIKGVDEENNITEIEWTSYIGTGIEPEADQPETEGRISVELDAAIIEAIAENAALVAVISK